MAFKPLKAEEIAAASVGILERLIVLGNLVERWDGSMFKGAKGDTVYRRIPARTIARQRALRAVGVNRVIQTDDLEEGSIPVTLDKFTYHATDLTDENLTLDIENFGEQILVPQVRSIAEKLELNVLDTIVNATYLAGLNKLAWNPAGTATSFLAKDAYTLAVKARAILNKAHVPDVGRVLLVGTDIESAILSDEKIRPGLSFSGLGEDALRRANIGQITGFEIISSPLIPDNKAYAFVKSAFIQAVVAPEVPAGVGAGGKAVSDGYGMTWTRDYDATIASDRSLIRTFSGTASTEDGKAPAGISGVTAGTPYNARAVEITATGL